MRPRRVLAVLPGVLAAGVAVVLPATSAGADSSVTLQAETTAIAAHLVVTQVPASSIVTESLVDDAVGYAASDFDGGGGSAATTAAAYPGKLVAQGPQLLCDEGVLPFDCPAEPPAYPLAAVASYPRNPTAEASVNGTPVAADPVAVVTPARSTASAHADGNGGTTTAGSLSLLAGTPGAVTAGSVTTTTRTTQSGSGGVVHVETTLGDVMIAGTVHIGSLRAVDDQQVVAGKRPHDVASVTVSGVTVAGQPATVDDRGIHVAGQNGPSIAQHLTQQGVTVRTVGVDRSDTPTGARSTAAALQVEVRLPVSGTPYVPNPLPAPFDAIPGVNANGTYVATMTLAAVGAAAGLATEPTFDLGDITLPGTVSGASTPPRSTTTATTTGATRSGTTSLPGASTASSGGGAPQVAAAPRLLRWVGLERLSLGTIYLVLAFGSAALFIGWRGAATLRMARRRS